MYWCMKCCIDSVRMNVLIYETYWCMKYYTDSVRMNVLVCKML